LRLREGRASKSRLRGQSDEAFITFDHARFALAYRLSSLTPMSVRTLSTIAHTRPASDILDFIGKGALIKIGARHNQTETIPNPSEVRFGSLADISQCPANVRFTPESRHRAAVLHFGRVEKQLLILRGSSDAETRHLQFDHARLTDQSL
jgi:hypothetical protein